MTAPPHERFPRRARSRRRRPEAPAAVTTRCRHHLVAGERAGLVGADHRDRAERLDRRQPADDRVAARHRLHADRQRDRQHRGQTLRDRGDRKADDGHEQLGERQMARRSSHRPRRTRSDDQDEDRQPAGEASIWRTRRRRERLDLDQHAADAADLGRRPGGDDHAAPGPRDQRAAERPCRCGRRAPRRPAPVRSASRPARTRRSGRPPRTRRPVAFEEPQIGRDLVAGLKQHDVARHQPLASTAGAGRRAARSARGASMPRIASIACSARALLDETDDGVDEDDPEDDAGIDQVIEQGGDQRQPAARRSAHCGTAAGSAAARGAAAPAGGWARAGRARRASASLSPWCARAGAPVPSRACQAPSFNESLASPGGWSRDRRPTVPGFDLGRQVSRSRSRGT